MYDALQYLVIRDSSVYGGLRILTDSEYERFVKATNALGGIEYFSKIQPNRFVNDVPTSNGYRAQNAHKTLKETDNPVMVKGAQVVLNQLTESKRCKQIIGKNTLISRVRRAIWQAYENHSPRVSNASPSVCDAANWLIEYMGLNDWMNHKSKSRQELHDDKAIKAQKVKTAFRNGVHAWHGRNPDAPSNDISPDHSVLLPPFIGARGILEIPKSLDKSYEDYCKANPSDVLPRVWRGDKKPPEDNGKNRGSTIISATARDRHIHGLTCFGGKTRHR